MKEAVWVIPALIKAFILFCVYMWEIYDNVDRFIINLLFHSLFFCFIIFVLGGLLYGVFVKDNEFKINQSFICWTSESLFYSILSFVLLLFSIYYSYSIIHEDLKFWTNWTWRYQSSSICNYNPIHPHSQFVDSSMKQFISTCCLFSISCLYIVS